MAKHKFEKGNSGRPVGTKNKVTQSAREAFQEAFEKMGGVDALMEWGQVHPSAFYNLYGRMIPIEHQHSGAVDIGDPRTALVGRLLQIVAEVPSGEVPPRDSKG